MSVFKKRKNNRQHYMEFIRASTAKWANCDPAKIIRAGDFGTLDKSGQFQIEGNIYQHSDISKIAANHPVPQSPGIDIVHVLSEAEQLAVGVAAEVSSKVIYQGKWRITTDSGAMLVMHGIQPEFVPDTFFPAALHIPVLREKLIVNEVYKCRGYFMYSSNTRGDNLTVRLHAGASSEAGAADAGANPRWTVETTSGDGQWAYRTNDTDIYILLYNWRAIRKK